MSQNDGKEHNNVDNGFPPILKSWSRVYSFVLGELALLIVLFYVISRFYR